MARRSCVGQGYRSSANSHGKPATAGTAPAVNSYVVFVSSDALGTLGYLVALMGPTFFICLVHLAMLSGESRTQFYGLAIGFALFAGMVAYGQDSHLFNPAISLGTWIAAGFAKGSAATHACLFLSQCLAGALSALAFLLCSCVHGGIKLVRPWQPRALQPFHRRDGGMAEEEEPEDTG